MDAWLLPLLTLVAGALLSGVGTYVGTRGKLRLDYDADLREKRITAYADLWARLEPLAKYGRKPTLSAAGTAKLIESLRTWYFEKGGLFLSVRTRGEYFALQDALARVAGDAGDDTGREMPGAVEPLDRAAGYFRREGGGQSLDLRFRPRLFGGRPRLILTTDGRHSGPETVTVVEWAVDRPCCGTELRKSNSTYS